MKKHLAWIITLAGLFLVAFIAYRIGYYGWPTVSDWGGAFVAIGASLLAIALIWVNAVVKNTLVRVGVGIVLLFGGLAVVGWLTSNGTHLGGILYWLAIIAAFVVPTGLVWLVTTSSKSTTP